MHVVFDSDQLALLCENMASSTKPEVHNFLHCRLRITKPRPQVTCTSGEISKFGHVNFETCELTDIQTDRQTDRHTDRNTSPYGAK